jgi:hypothetical protein
MGIPEIDYYIERATAHLEKSGLTSNVDQMLGVAHV